MNKFLKWFTREREEFFYGIMLLIGLGGAALYSMEIVHHPVHLELDHVRMEEAYNEMVDHTAESGCKDIPEPTKQPPIIDLFNEQDQINREILNRIDLLNPSGDIKV